MAGRRERDEQWLLLGGRIDQSLNAGNTSSACEKSCECCRRGTSLDVTEHGDLDFYVWNPEREALSKRFAGG